MSRLEDSAKALQHQPYQKTSLEALSCGFQFTWPLGFNFYLIHNQLHKGPEKILFNCFIKADIYNSKIQGPLQNGYVKTNPPVDIKWAL